jgi:hypothetical protein
MVGTSLLSTSYTSFSNIHLSSLYIDEVIGDNQCGFRRHGSPIGKTGRHLAVGIREHRRNFKEGLLEKSKLAQHVYEACQKVMWHEARILGIEANSRYTKYRETAHVACLTNPISQPSLDIPPIWIPLISDEITNSKRSLRHNRLLFVGFLLFSSP